MMKLAMMILAMFLGQEQKPPVDFRHANGCEHGSEESEWRQRGSTLKNDEMFSLRILGQAQKPRVDFPPDVLIHACTITVIMNDYYYATFG